MKPILGCRKMTQSSRREKGGSCSVGSCRCLVPLRAEPRCVPGSCPAFPFHPGYRFLCLNRRLNFNPGICLLPSLPGRSFKQASNARKRNKVSVCPGPAPSPTRKSHHGSPPVPRGDPVVYWEESSSKFTHARIHIC